jgi:hypothetical protein
MPHKRESSFQEGLEPAEGSKSALSDLLPCPFCGEGMNSEEFEVEDMGSGPPPARCVVCGGCGARGPMGYGRGRGDTWGAVDAAKVEWNKRAG